MIPALMILIPCCLVGGLVYLAMANWELPPSGPSSGGHGGGSRRLPPLTMRDTYLDWPVPQLQRLHPGVLVAICAVLAVWVVAWIVIFFVGLGMLHA